MSAKTSLFYTKAKWGRKDDNLEKHSFINDRKHDDDERHRGVGIWLLICGTILVWCLSIGGTTRLSGSGLSIARWDVLDTLIPPLTDKQWELEFEHYKKFPEYKMKHSGLTTAALPIHRFKSMWMMAYFHRALSHLLALAFFIPCGIFWYKGHLNRRTKFFMVFCGVLLVLEAIVGWFVVKSGLTNEDGKSAENLICPYRLFLHLILGFFLYIGLLWPAFAHIFKPVYYVEAAQHIKCYRGLIATTIAFILITVSYGAFVAGLNAGAIYNTWPLFDGRVFPANMYAQSPFIKNFFENPGTVQFWHRTFAYITFGLVIATWVNARKLSLHKRARVAVNAMLLFGVLQIVIGIANLLLGAPGWIAAVHQSGAMTLLFFILWLLYEISHSSRS
ncbi:unnamed protein product [Bursaphelenchus xylophilus]|uniref:(pine wood nematode) hypothetical protein n=1 Tax=Bursaphelenchus xylophilus TaxID=6326 RepID=A0A1I7RXV0_BURXY|nr:unnamed protein product [Bursaphelenchus xylophilus]CAG9125183.1 unnamed protein product [Bursaphelenchus xylophilus]